MIVSKFASGGSAWPRILLVVGAGVVSAFQVGKAPVALAAIQEDLALSLAAASWLISAFAILGALTGAPIGLAADRVGAGTMAALGLLLQAAGSFLGGLASGFTTLLATRVIEGLGFLCLVVAGPALIAGLAPIQIRDRAMSLWASFMPVGLTVIMLAAPLLSIVTWRGFWFLNASILLSYAMLLRWGLHPPSSQPRLYRNVRQDIGEALVSPGPWVLGGLFAAFSAIFFAVFGLLPSLLSQRIGISNDAASMLSALAIAASGVGNLVCGQLLARGFLPGRLLHFSFGIMAICGIGIFSQALWAIACYALCVVFSFAGGLIPVVIFDSAPRQAPRPELVGVTIGFAMQGNNLGLIIGPAAAGGISGAFGWPLVSVAIVAMALMAALLVLLFNRRQLTDHAIHKEGEGALW
ncbi:MFS transporter [Sinorhizobium medicae]|uniref:MFS transporter n=1 Tax=Sinorhizobium medicae TaxID=110321 RepID=UPI00119FC58E|nr:MFS transporter [Sinorhizobium medicae]MDX0466502.1 MFS transporter [Sinorhizobium medicae]MDX0657244.1 MFS transporter [Sinorhizobium medicae]MDX1073021.1 MFS transporter [Sinorhizobium medicae]MDX1173645.1 MFS transporter [Sinorhizobium medicae]MDX1197927.1 MFS transporter [Sinorhizobium medicae]